ncbi:MAG: LUD domain-containing protein [bacterium]
MSERTKLKQKISQTLRENYQRQALLSAVQRGRNARLEALRSLPNGETFQQEIKALKDRCVDNLKNLVRQFTEKATERGATVYFARTAKEACDYVVRLAQAKKARKIIKSKSLTSEEIDLNRPLEQANCQVVETDLGERIIQMAQEKPYHLVFPAVHKTAAQVAELFRAESGVEVSADLGDIMRHMRQRLRPIFLGADIGVTGANIAIAETGGIVIETNEGNGRLVSTIPPVHVCIMGAEKIVETIEEALQLILAHPVSAVGQMLTTYDSFIAGRSPLGGQHGRECHIVILDNGRLQMRQDPWYREALNCIRCGACMNICPTYGVLGGHVFGYIYPGPIGIPWTARTHGLDKAAEFVDCCISCGLCKEICPAAIDIPMMIAKVKHQVLQSQSQLLSNKILMASESFAKLACATAPVSNWILQRKTVKYLTEKLAGIDRRRHLPTFERKTFKKQFIQKTQKAQEKCDRKVAFFVDYHANYNRPELGLRALEILQKANVKVVLPKQRASGYPYISYGELEKARKTALYNIEHFYPYATEGYDVVTLEPTAAYALKSVYPKLLGYSKAAKGVAESTFEFFEYVENLILKDVLKLATASNDPRTFGFHIACHQRGSSAGTCTLRLLQASGYDVRVIETGTCCGMAGTFGLKHGPLGYDLAMTVGEWLFQLFKNSGVSAIITESSVCKMQLEDGTGLQVLHPLELIAAA